MEDRRASIGKREDRRVRRTRHLLEQGLIELLSEKPVRSITVRELTDRVDINRGTFYLYYRDIYDMVEKLEAEYFAAFERRLNAHDSEPVPQRIKSTLLDLFAFMGENRELCRILLSDHGDMAFLQKINQAVKEKCRYSWPENAGFSDTEFEYRYSFSSFGIMGIVHTWLSADCPEPAAEVAALTEICITHGVLPGIY